VGGEQNEIDYLKNTIEEGWRTFRKGYTGQSWYPSLNKTKDPPSFVNHPKSSGKYTNSQHREAKVGLSKEKKTTGIGGASERQVRFPEPLDQLDKLVKREDAEFRTR